MKCRHDGSVDPHEAKCSFSVCYSSLILFQSVFLRVYLVCFSTLSFSALTTCFILLQTDGRQQQWWCEMLQLIRICCPDRRSACPETVFHIGCVETKRVNVKLLYNSDS